MAEMIKVNFSNEEASSESFDFEPLPSGNYPVILTDGEIRESTSEKNKGKPYWHLEFTVIEGHPNEGRKFWGNVMLFEGALYSLAQLAKAIGMEDQIIKKGKVPSIDDIVGKELVLRIQKKRNTYLEERDGSDTPIWTNEVKGYASAGTKGAASKSSSVLP